MGCLRLSGDMAEGICGVDKEGRREGDLLSSRAQRRTFSLGRSPSSASHLFS